MRAAYVLPARTLPRPARYVPHIYTDRELADLFAATDGCQYSLRGPVPAPGHAGAVPDGRPPAACASPKPGCSAPATSTSAPGSLQIRDAKGGKDRQVPVSEPLRHRLACYRSHLAGRNLSNRMERQAV